MKKMKINFPLQAKRKYVDSIVRVYKNPQVIKVMKEPAVKAISLVTIAMLVFGLVGMVAPFKTEATSTGDLVAWWRFEGDLTDETGVNDGTGYGSITYASGKIGQALELNGTDDYVNVGDNTSLNFTNDFTVEAWINGDAFQSTYYDLITFRGYNKWAFGVFHGNRLMFGE